MDDISLPVFSCNVIKKQTLFSVNDIQVIFNTDFKTAKKLEDDEVLKDYLQAVIQANLLSPYGIVNTTQITSIERLDTCDADKVIVALDIATNVQQGVEELRCCVAEDSTIYNAIEEPSNSEDSFTWNQQVPDLTTGPAFRWNSEMTTSLIKIRGDLDREFSHAKYKFRLWEKVAAKLNTLLVNVKVTAKDCDDKWRNIVATYRKNIDKIKCFGDNSIRWEYFTAMDNILKGTKELNENTGKINEDERMAKLIDELNHTEYTPEAESVEIVDMSADQFSEEEEEPEETEEDESFQNSIITRKVTDEKRKWSTEMCLSLLLLRYQMDSKFKESYENTPHLWKEITNQMNEKFLTDLSASELECVWNHCLITYEINLENLKSKGVDTVKWKYFAVLDELLGGTSEISDICIPRPGEHLLKKFNRLVKNNVLRSNSLDTPQTDSLCFNANFPEQLNNESDTDENSFSVSGTVWTKDMVRTLITLKKEINQEIANNKVTRKRQWTVIVRRFRAVKNMKLSEESCEEKWRNLLRTYKKNLLRVRKQGTSIKWPFFWKMREAVGNSVLAAEQEKRNTTSSSLAYTDSFASTRLKGGTDTMEPNFRLAQKSLIGGDDFVEDADDMMMEDKSNDQYENAVMMMNDFKQNQTKLIQEMFTQQNKIIEGLHQEQQNIKTLLTQLLQKLT